MQAARRGALAFLPTVTLTIALAGAAQGQEKRPAQAPTSPQAPAAVTALIPQPRSVDYRDGWLPVNGSFRVEWLGHRNSVLDRAVVRFQNDVARRTGVDAGRGSCGEPWTITWGETVLIPGTTFRRHSQ